MKISVVLITHLRHVWLERAIRSLLQAEKLSPAVQLEFVIWINGSDDQAFSTTELLRKEFGRSSFFVTHNPHRMTPAKARNEALDQATNEWVFFIDDDAYVDPGFFHSFLSSTVEFPAAVAVGGPNLTPPGSSLFQIASGLVLSSRLGAYSSFSRYQRNGKRRECNEDSIILCNLFVRKSALGESPFPEKFLCNEENWLMQTLRAKGDQIIYDPSMPVQHERRAGVFLFLKQVFIYGFGRGQNIKIRPSTLRLAHVFPSICTLIGLGSVCYGLSTRQVPKYFGFLLAAYLSLCLVAAALKAQISRTGIMASCLSFFLFPLLHVSYGLGVLYGLIGFNDGTLPFHLWRERPGLNKR